MVRLRLQRQDLLSREQPPQVWVVMDETVLRWPVGGPAVMRDRIDQLTEVSDHPRVQVQMMPFGNSPHPGMPAGAFQLFRFEACELPDVVHLGTLVGSMYFDDEADVLLCRRTLDRLSAQAVRATKMRDPLGPIRKEL